MFRKFAKLATFAGLICAVVAGIWLTTFVGNTILHCMFGAEEVYHSIVQFTFGVAAIFVAAMVAIVILFVLSELYDAAVGIVDGCLNSVN